MRAWKGSDKTSKLAHPERRTRLAKWVTREVMPHEKSVRSWLRRSRLSPEDIDETVQDCYCRFAMLDTVDHIARADVYFFTIARNLLTRRLKRAKIIPIDALSEVESVAEIIDESPSPEQQTAARMDYERLRSCIADLPERCREIFELRKFEGCSQKEIARRMNVSESVVENELFKGMRALQAAWRAVDAPVDDQRRVLIERSRQA